MINIKRVFKVWFAWNPEKIEQYLEDMALKGWRVERVSCSQMYFRFIRNSSRKVSVCVDYRVKPSHEYLSLLDDDGWELINQRAGWMLWCKPYTDEKPQLFTDYQSLIDRNQKIVFFITLSLASQFPMILSNAIGEAASRYFPHFAVGRIILFSLYALCILFMLYGLIRLLILNGTLKNQTAAL